MILFAGALLLTPGFFTDAVGLALLTPPVRRAVLRYLQARVKVETFNYGTPPPKPADPEVIDGEWEEVTPSKRPTHGPSGWTKH
jgi:UPF0716 protein FxsA